MIMKKFMMMAMMAAAATTTFAQDALVKEAKKQFSKKDFDAAVQTLTPALTSAETTDKAAAWNLLTDIYYQQYSDLADAAVKSAMTHENVDSASMYKFAIKAWESAVKTDEYDQQPDAKGKVKRKFLTANQNRFKPMAAAFVQGGQYFYGKKDQAEAVRLWKAYADMRETSVFAEMAEKDFPKEPFYADILYYASFLSYQLENYSDAIKYAKRSLEADPSKKDDCDEIMLFAMKDGSKTAADSLEYLNFVKAEHKANPENERYFNLLMDYYRNADAKVKEAWLEEEINVNPNNKMAYAIKGEAMMNAEKWDEAVAAFKKAVEIDPSWVPCMFNIGICLNSKAIALNDELMDKKTMGLTPENAEKVKAVLKDALVYLEKTRELDPDQLETKWAYPLYRIYYSLQNKEKMAEIEAIDPSLKN